MEKNLMTTILVAALVAVVVAVIAMGVDEIGLSPRTESNNAPATINAHRCDADGVCETNVVKVNRGLCSEVSSEMIIKALDLAGSDEHAGMHLKEGEKV